MLASLVDLLSNVCFFISLSQACIHSVAVLQWSRLYWCSYTIYDGTPFRCWYDWSNNGRCKSVLLMFLSTIATLILKYPVSYQVIHLDIVEYKLAVNSFILHLIKLTYHCAWFAICNGDTDTYEWLKSNCYWFLSVLQLYNTLYFILKSLIWHFLLTKLSQGLVPFYTL